MARDLRFLFRVLVLVLRYAAGLPLDGKRRTDATFWRRGSMVTDPHWWGPGWAWWGLRPGWQRAAVRLAPVAAAVGWWKARTGTEWAAAVILGPLTGWLAWRAVRGVILGRHRRVVIRPLAAALAPALESSPAEVERTLWVPRGRELHERDAEVVAALPAHHQGTGQQTDAVARIVGQRLGGEWQARITRDPLAIVATHRPEPPRRVDFREVAELIRSQGSATRLLMGLGADHEPVWLDFGSEVAHLGVSVGTGGGKSAFLRFLVAQFAYFGCADFPVIDSKMVSLDGMEAIPGLRVYRETPEQWAALRQLREDMEARYARLLADRSATFPPRVTLLEEQNDFAIESRAYWQQIKPPRAPMTPPVYSDMTRLLIKGRQVSDRVIGVYQRLSAAACGGLDAGVFRDSYGMKALSRFSPQAWDALVGIRPRGASSVIPGRWVLVMGHQVRAVQVPYAEAGELVDFARSSPAPGVPVERENAAAPVVSAFVPRDTGPVGRDASCPAPGLVVGLDAAADVLSMSYHGFRKARQRRPIPGECTEDGRPAWLAGDLAAWRGGAS